MENRPTTAIIDKDALRHNYLEIKKHLARDVNILAVVKADAYGHGAKEVSKTLEGLGCKYLGVAILEEGIELRNAGIRSDIIILGGIYNGQADDVIKYNLTPVVYDMETAEVLNNAAKGKNQKIKIHVKIDTGMGRLGILPEEVSSFFNRLKGLKNIEVEGVITHLAEIDEDERGYSGAQMNLFLKAINMIKEAGFDPMLKHIANSAAAINLPSLHFNLVRPGLMLYGVYPEKRLRQKIKLKPMMEIKSRIIQLKRIPAGSSVSYGRTFTAKRETIIGVVPVGYGDGYLRCLSNKGEMLVHGTRTKVVGVVCMDLTMLDVTDINNVSKGDEVTILGKNGDEEITAEELAEKCNTIPYEILCGISKRVPRVYKG